jgi:predicted N-formylglutamate amidohydrolase
MVRSQECFDIGAADLSYQICERMKSLGVFANFSKLLVDPSKPLTDLNLVKTSLLMASG